MGPLVIEDAAADARFRDSPLCRDPHRVRTFATVPLFGAGSDLPVGSLCIMDRVVRHFTPKELTLLRLLGAQAQAHLCGRRPAADLRYDTLNGVIGMNTLLLNSVLSDKQRGYALTVKSSSEALLMLINDILDFTRLEEGHLEIARVVFDPRTLIEEGLSVGCAEAKVKGLRLFAQVAKDVPERMIGDPLRIGQILHNLVSNAVKFTERGEVRISASAVSLTGPGEVPGQMGFRLSVSDTGIGIPKQAFSRLFQAFSQVDSSMMTRKYGGTGLGLAICHRLSEAMGGEITVQSEPGRGSEFTLSLRLPAADPREIGHTGSSSMLAVPTGKQTQADWELTPMARSCRVLVVDDNGVNALVVGAMLEKLGCQAQTVDSGAGALVVLTKETFDLVLMDCQMPEMDGYEATRRIRAEEPVDKVRRMPIVALTANVLVGDQERCRLSGMDDYLSKPVGVQELRAAIERWVAP